MEPDGTAGDQCQAMNDALISFLLKASVRGCGGGRDTVSLYIIFILDKPCAIPTSPGVQRRNKRKKKFLPDAASQMLNREDKMPPVAVEENAPVRWRPRSDIGFTPDIVYKTQELQPGRLVKRDLNGAAGNRNNLVVKKRRSNGKETNVDPIVLPTEPAFTLPSPGPQDWSLSNGAPVFVFQRNRCDAGGKIDFVLRVPESSENLRALLRHKKRPTFSIDVVTSPTLLRYPYRNWRIDEEEAVADEIQYKSASRVAQNGKKFWDFILTYIHEGPIRGHVLVFFQVESIEGLHSEELFDVSFVCGSTGLGMDVKLNQQLVAPEPTIPLMVWNVNKLGNVAGKTEYLKDFAKKFDVGIWIEAKSTVFQALKKVADKDIKIQGVRPWDYSKTQDQLIPNVNLDFVLSLSSSHYAFGSPKCVKLPPAPGIEELRGNTATMLARAPCATLITSDLYEPFYVIPVHWASVPSPAQRRLETERLLMYMEFIRVSSGLRVAVAGDFNTEWGSLMHQGFSDENKEWMAAYMQFGTREIPQTNKATKMHHFPKEYDFIWHPFGLHPFQKIPKRFEREQDNYVASDANGEGCSKTRHRTMSREFSNHHPIIFDLTISKRGEPVLRFTLVSHNIQHFNWAYDNPFNSAARGRQRGVVLMNYLKQFHVVALQEVSQKIVDLPEGQGDDEEIDESEDDDEVQDSNLEQPTEDEDMETDFVNPNSVNTESECVPGMLFDKSIREMKPADTGSPLSLGGNLVKIAPAFGEELHCETMRMYVSGKWDIKIW
ncbi:hypothetical protein HDU89_001066 [Geranomyces variabilis]|nr:hypothetical protein HDU89_001066 [Geranomyces variabilis]